MFYKKRCLLNFIGVCKIKLDFWSFSNNFIILTDFDIPKVPLNVFFETNALNISWDHNSPLSKLKMIFSKNNVFYIPPFTY